MKKLLLLFLFLLVVGFLIIILYSQSRQTGSLLNFAPTPTPINAPPVNFGSINYQKIFPDPEIAQAVIDTLHIASGSSQKDEYTVVSFATTVDQRPNQVYEQNNTAQYILQERTADNSDLKTFLDAHPGIQGFQMFDASHAGSGFSWYVYPQEGMAFLANKDFGYAIKVLYFPKTTREEFTKTAAKTFDLLTTDPDNEELQENFQESP